MMVDTQRQDMLHCYDSDFMPTDALDGLAREGVRFDNAFTCQPVCGPARSAIFTGLYPHSNGMVANCMQLGANVKTAGQWISPHGVSCAYVGKWHLDGGDYFGYGKCPDGYLPEYWYDMRNYLDELTPEQRRLSRVNMVRRSDDPREEDTYAHRCVDRAIDFVRKYAEKDFFLTVSLDEPHDPSVCPQRFFRKMRQVNFKFKRLPNVNASLKSKPDHQRVWAKHHKGTPFWAVRQGMKSMFACDLFCDYELGRLLKEVKRLGLRPMIVHTSDHGDMMLSHRIVGKGCVMYNEITRIPLIISGGGFGQGTEKTPVSHIDLLPTIMEHLGVPIPKMMQGEKLQGLAHNARRDVFTEFTRYEVDHDGFMGYQPIRCIFDGRYKLAINLLTSDEFYDLEKDPYEKTNLIDTKDPSLRKVRDGLHDRLLQQMNVTRDVYRGYYWACRPWRKGKKASWKNDGFTRQLVEEDFVQLDYNTGMPMKGDTRKQ